MSAPEHGRLGARPGSRGGDDAPEAGTEELHAPEGGSGLLRVPAGHRAGEAAPLVVLLHGAGGDARGGLRPLEGLADEAGLVLLAPGSLGATWDVIQGGFGPDVEALDALLWQVFARVAVDPTRLAIGGFSDGASYALSLGVTNGDLFSHVVAFSPGFLAPGAQQGAPGIFVSHGVADAVLPIERCSRRLVPALREAGYEVRYEEFEGGHVVPPPVAAQAVAWLGAP